MTETATDPSAMGEAVQAFPDHLETGWQRGEAFESLKSLRDRVDHVVVCGMGGSAIGGDLLAGYVATSAPVPVTVVRGYEMPAWVGPRTLVVASSYSGNTEETRSAFRDALDRQARVLVVTTGGKLGDLADKHDLPQAVIPGGMQPRAALGYSLGVLVRLARALGLVDLPDHEVEAALDAARRAAETNSHADSPAARTARALKGRLPVVYTGAPLLRAVGLRWQTQIHENAKHPAYGRELPEQNHNEIMGFEASAVLVAPMAVVALRDRSEHARVQRRFEITRDLVAPRLSDWVEVESEGPNRLGRMLHLVQYGDAVSYHLSQLKGVDPTPVDTIESLKATLAKARTAS